MIAPSISQSHRMLNVVHEGSAVTSGYKYIVRTDVLYMNPPQKGQGGR